MENIYKALVAFQKNTKTIPKDKTVKVRARNGATYQFNYADLAGIQEAIKDTLAENGLGYTQLLSTQDGNPCLITRLFHESGETIESTTNILHPGSDIKDFGGSITYYRRYALSAILGLVTDDCVDEALNDDTQNENFTQQKQKKKPAVEKKGSKLTTQQVFDLEKNADTKRLEKMMTFYGVHDLYDLTENEYAHAMSLLKQ